jgi:hypothetical protein
MDAVYAVTDGERIACDQRDRVVHLNNELLVELSAARAELATAREIIEGNAAMIVELCDTITRLKAEGNTPPSDVRDPEPVKPAPKPPNPFREFPTDRRRIGG